MFQTEALKTQLTEEQQRNFLIMVTKEVVKSVEKNSSAGTEQIPVSEHSYSLLNDAKPVHPRCESTWLHQQN